MALIGLLSILALLAAAGPAQAAGKLRVKKNFGNVVFPTFTLNAGQGVTVTNPPCGCLENTVDPISGGAPRTWVVSDLVVAVDADPEADGVVRGRVGGAEPIDVFRLDARDDSTNERGVNTRRYAVLLTLP